jgi:hypothetical protein
MHGSVVFGLVAMKLRRTLKGQGRHGRIQAALLVGSSLQVRECKIPVLHWLAMDRVSCDLASKKVKVRHSVDE